jgi:hypothetical protein
MISARTSFDWLAFVVRFVVIASLATWLLLERLRAGDVLGSTTVVVIGYFVLPVLAYLHTRYFNRGFRPSLVDKVLRVARRS